jgi:hypothetical protein
MGGIQVYVKKQLRLDLLNIPQRMMAELGQVALDSVKQRVSEGRGPNDGPALPLGRGYASFKSRMGLKPIRDLRGTGGAVLLKAGRRRKADKLSAKGHMLDNLTLRTVSDNHARAAFTTEAMLIKARANQRREPFMVFSPRDNAAVKEAAQRLLNQIKDRLVRQ